VRAEHDHLEVHRPGSLTQPDDLGNAVPEVRAVSPLLVALVRAPPVLHPSTDGHAQLEVAHRPGLVVHAVLALDHHRPGVATGPEDGAFVPRERGLVPPEVLHRGVRTDRDALQVAVRGAEATLHETRTRAADVAAEARTLVPAAAVAEQVQQLALIAHDDLE